MMKKVLRIFIVFILSISFISTNVHAAEFTKEKLQEDITELIKEMNLEDDFYGVTLNDNTMIVHSKYGNIQYNYTIGDTISIKRANQTIELNKSDDQYYVLMSDVMTLGLVYSAVAKENGLTSDKSFIYVGLTILEEIMKEADQYSDINSLAEDLNFKINDSEHNSYSFATYVSVEGENSISVESEMTINTKADFAEIDKTVSKTMDDLTSMFEDISDSFLFPATDGTQTTTTDINKNTVTDIFEGGSAGETITQTNNNVTQISNTNTNVQDETKQENRMPYTGVMKKNKVMTIAEISLLLIMVVVFIINKKGSHK